jgi:hypothetical protein
MKAFAGPILPLLPPSWKKGSKIVQPNSAEHTPASDNKMGPERTSAVER